MLKRHLVFVVVGLAFVVAGCSSDDGAGDADADTSITVGGFMVQDGDLVEVHYDGTLDDGSTFDSSRERGTPLSFTVGTGEVLSGFDDAVRGLKVGESRTVRLEAVDAYGVRSDDNIVEVPYGPGQSDVAVGDEVFLNNGRPAVVLEVNDATVILDVNHSLADEALTFEIEVLAITRP
jgi:FKBP-type peptidyl-prolyl cis-trans isomerase 2/predicted small secreted protein